MSKLKLNADSGGGSVAFEGAASSSSDKVIKFPAAPGVIVQVVSVSTTQTATSTSTSWSTTGFQTDITPTSTSSKILIQCSGPMTGFAGGGTHQRGGLKLYRGGSGGTSVESSTNGLSCQYSADSTYSDVHLLWWDAPATTSAITYTIMLSRRGGSGTYSFIRDGAQTGTLVLMEVAGL
tara:strand:+ start:1351 stop:1887 length:537 start_codon:yes stop_codon:yes gene_type:complete